MIKFILKNKIITVVVLVILAVGGYFIYQGAVKNKSAIKYVTAAVEKGTLTVSVSGSGQIGASDQIDIKSKASGDLLYLADLQNGKEIKNGALITRIDSKNAQKTVRDAEIALETAELELADLLAPPDNSSLLQTNNALSNAQNNLDKAETNLEEVKTDSEQNLEDAYNDAYSDLSGAFSELSDYIDDLENVAGSDSDALGNINLYKIVLGSDSSFIKKFIDGNNQARDLFNNSYLFFKNLNRSSGRENIYKSVNDALEAAKKTLQALEDAKSMLDETADNSSSAYTEINSKINSAKPIVSSDISSVEALISSLQKIKDDIDNATEDAPQNIKNAELTIESAKQSLAEKELSLQELKDGADSSAIRNKRLSVEQKKEALVDAKENLADYSIYAPFEGIISAVNIKKGDSISSGTVLVSLITKQQIAKITLNEVDVASVKIGQKANITFDAIDGLNLTGTVAEVDTVGTATQGVVNYGVKIIFDAQDDRAKHGMSLSVAIITDVKQDALLIPNSAVKQNNNSSYVQVISASDGANKNTASVAGALAITASNLQAQAVQTGLANDSMTEIVSGLNEGDIVVTQTIDSSKTKATNSTTKTTISGFGGSGIKQMMR